MHQLELFLTDVMKKWTENGEKKCLMSDKPVDGNENVSY